MAIFFQFERPVAQALCLNGGKEAKTIRADLNHQNILRDKIFGYGYINCPADGIRVLHRPSESRIHDAHALSAGTISFFDRVACRRCGVPHPGFARPVGGLFVWGRWESRIFRIASIRITAGYSEGASKMPWVTLSLSTFYPALIPLKTRSQCILKRSERPNVGTLFCK